MKAQSLSVVILVVFGTFICGVFGARWQGRVPQKPGHPNQCYDEVTGDYHAAGESWRRPSKCEGIFCGGPDESAFMIISGSSCSYASRLPSNCRMSPEKAGVEYPDCCPKLECDGEPNGSISMVG